MRRAGVLLAAFVLCAAGQSRGVDLPDWFDGPPGQWPARQAIALLSDAGSHGLVAQDYDAPALKRAIEQAATPPVAARPTLDTLGAALTASMMRYLTDLHRGRVDPRQIHLDFAPARDDGFDAGATLRRALEVGRLDEAVAEAAPRVRQYGQLREALARVRALSGHPAWREDLPPLPAAGRHRAKLEPGAAWAGLPRLAQRLEAWGDLPAGLPAPAAYDATLESAVRAFQRRHGLADDGVLGADTLAELQVGPEVRARQIELALERLRWTPLTQSRRMVTINVPEFVLRTYEVEDGRPHLRDEMAVIVGRAMATQTPLFDGQMRFIEFSPYWNVPPSIARGEIVPRLRRDPAYFERQGFEFVGAGGVSRTLNDDNLARVLAGQLRIRQRPGAANALGGIKFVFPNNEHIYLHHTPATELFSRARRDFSHGCIRVADPVALARFVLQPQPEWTEEAIRGAMTRGASSTLRLTEPVTVLIAYTTTVVKEGRLHFLRDLYGHDRRLDTALRQRAPQAGTIARP